jgi:hypothetical protein
MARSKILLIAVVHLLVFVFALSANAQLTSSYTSIAEKSCRKVKLTKADEGVILHRRCHGVVGYQLDIFSGEEHEYMSVRTPGGKSFDVSINPASYSFLDKRAEWRMRGATPVALIVRFNLSMPDGKPVDSILVVSKLTRTSACVVDRVDKAKDQNAKARKIADTASTRECKPSQ